MFMATGHRGEAASPIVNVENKLWACRLYFRPSDPAFPLTTQDPQVYCAIRAWYFSFQAYISDIQDELTLGPMAVPGFGASLEDARGVSLSPSAPRHPWTTATLLLPYRVAEPCGPGLTDVSYLLVPRSSAMNAKYPSRLLFYLAGKHRMDPTVGTATSVPIDSLQLTCQGRNVTPVDRVVHGLTVPQKRAKAAQAKSNLQLGFPGIQPHRHTEP
ncbi:hypothetical protein C8R46DRAFT_1287090 [Mycena filopes]|nr:hypothetical protein C8R46DRAFT_1287090 [Mycena filopes]